MTRFRLRAFRRMGNDLRYRLQPIPAIIQLGENALLSILSTRGTASQKWLLPQIPEAQSWTAFSPDGSLFVVGSPLKLTPYRLP